MKITLSHGTFEDCSIKMEKYANDRPAMVIYHDDEVLLKATVNLPDHNIPEGYVYIKDWSENEGVLKSLIAAKVIEAPEIFLPSGFVYVPVCKLLI